MCGGVCILFLVIASLLYIPAVQNFVKNRACDYVTNNMGIRLSVERVRLAFPIDLTLDNALAVKGKDTLLYAGHLRLHAELFPLLGGKVELGGVKLTDAKLNTLGMVSNTQVIGEIGSFFIRKPTAINLLKSDIIAESVELSKSNLSILLCDTAQQDTTESEPTTWNIKLNKISIVESSLKLRMPGDSMRIAADIGKLNVQAVTLGLAEEDYRVSKIDVSGSSVAYDIPQAAATGGFDTNHLFVDDLTIKAKDLTYTGGALNAEIEKICLHEEGSGLQVKNLSCGVELDDKNLSVKDFNLLTAGETEIAASITMAWNSLEEGGNGKFGANLKGKIGRSDVLAFMGEAATSVEPYYPSTPIEINVDASGSVDSLGIDTVRLTMPGLLALSAEGSARNLMDSVSRQVDIAYSLQSLDSKKMAGLLPSEVQAQINIPNSLNLNGEVGLNGTYASTNSVIKAENGSIDLKAEYNTESQNYTATMEAVEFPLDVILKGMNVSRLTAKADAKGYGFDFSSRSTQMSLAVDIDKLRYETYILDNCAIGGILQGGILSATIEADNDMLRADLTAQTDLCGKDTELALNGIISDLAVEYLSESVDSTHVGGRIEANALIGSDGTRMEVAATIADLFVSGQEVGFMGEDMTFDFHTSNDGTTAVANSGDLNLNFESEHQIGQLGEDFVAFGEVLLAQLQGMDFNEEELLSKFPQMDLSMNAGKSNLLCQLLEVRGYEFDSVHVSATNEIDEPLMVEAQLLAFNSGGIMLDSTTLSLKGDTSGINFVARIDNTSPENPNLFAASVEGELLEHGMEIFSSFRDGDGVQGVEFGLRAVQESEGNWSMHLFPDTMTLAYRKFSVNDGNFVTISPDLQVAADIDLQADDETGVKLTSNSEELGRDITLTLNHVNLAELTATLPFLPALEGLLGGDIHAKWTDSLDITANGNIEVEDFGYEHAPVGSFSCDFAYLPGELNSHSLSATLNTDSADVLMVDGVFYEDDGNIDATVTLANLPMDLVNGFIGNDGTVALAGHLDGEILLSGTTDNIAINGSLAPDSLTILSPLYNVSLLVEDRPINLVDSRLTLDSVRITNSDDDNPLWVNGNVDMSNLEKIEMDIAFSAENFKLIDAEEDKESLVYGEVWANVDATLKGTTEFMRIVGTLDILDQTDVTYIMKDTPLTVEDQLSGLVEFVDLQDTVTVVADTTQAIGGIFMNLAINVGEGAQVHALLSTDGSSYVNASGGGNLQMQYLPNGEMKLTGVYTLTSGEMKYELPIIPLKTFTISDGSSVRFTGDVFDPTLNITAMESTRAAVSDDGETTRMVDFNVGVGVTQKLSNMELAFLIEAPSDLSVQNDLSSVSAEERSKIALTLLATGVYMSDNNQSSFKANNALNAFLQSEINSIAGNALKSVDLTVGVEGTTSATGETQTDYSFQFTKHFWNDRITFKLGGKVTTGSTTEDENQTFIDNVSLEYRLDKTGTKSLQAFYDHSGSDPFEGTYSSAGVGFVWRKKMDRLSELLIFKKEEEDTAAPTEAAPKVDDETTDRDE